MKWLCLVYKQDEAEMKFRLDILKGRGLLQDVDMKSGEISMHDLYGEFAELEVRGKWDESRDVESRKWAYVENGDLSELGSGHKCLRSFELCDVYGVEGVEGLEGLKYLTYFRWITGGHFDEIPEVQTRMGRFPASLVILEILDKAVLIGQDVLARCSKLCRLFFCGIQGDKLDLSSCSSLQSVSVDSMRSLSGLTTPTACGIKLLEVVFCGDLVGIPRLEQFFSLERLEITKCLSMAQLQLDLQRLTKLQVLHIACDQFSSLRLPLQLRELYLHPAFHAPERIALVEVPKAVEALRANRLKQLQVLDLSHNSGILGLENVGGWPALRRLDLSWCVKVSGLPDLSESTNLEELSLMGCEMELHDEDIRMLAGLPLLQPVPIGSKGDIRLDVVRWKELSYGKYIWRPVSWEEWKKNGWEERDLGIPPYRIDRR